MEDHAVIAWGASSHVFSCPRCAGQRRVLAFLTQGAVIRRILRHLLLPAQPPRLAPALGPAQQALWESLSAEGRTLSSSSRQPLARARQWCAWSATCRPPWGASFTVQGLSQGPPGPPPTPALVRNRTPLRPILSRSARGCLGKALHSSVGGLLRSTRFHE